MMTKIRQEAALSDRRVLGYYKYKDIFQIMPIPEDAPSLGFLIGHHPFLMEYSYEVPDVSETQYNPEIPSVALLPMIDREASTSPKNEVLLLLSTFSRHIVFQYGNSITNQQWFVKLPMNEKDIPTSYDSVWGQGAYQSQKVPSRIIEGFSNPSAEPIGVLEINEYYKSELPLQYVVGLTHDSFELPVAIDEYFNIYYSMANHTKLSFLSACMLLRQGIELFSLAPSLAFAACVSALEALIAHDHRTESTERCECCNQPKHHVRQRFLHFIKEFGNDSPESRRQADRVYSKRSSILHEGQLFLGVIEPKTIDLVDDWINDNRSRREVIRFFRICLINWLVRQKAI